MNREQMLLALKLKDRYAALGKEMRTCQDKDRYLAISAEMADVRDARAALEPKRPVGRPRVRPAGVRRSFGKGTVAQQLRARDLRRQKAVHREALRRIKLEFDELALHGGPSC
jgi:predicted  nucleic acid-binding Zn-ribbon protein